MEYIDNQSIRKEDFLTSTGISASNFKGSGAKSELGGNKIAKILTSYPNLDPRWLLTGIGDMTGKGDYRKIEKPTDVVNEPSTKYESKFNLMTDVEIDDQTVPLYNLEATAGIVELFKDQEHAEVIDTLKIPNLPKCDGAVFVTGDSMYPILKSGDIVIYKKIEDFSNNIFWGEMYLISIEVEGDQFTSVKYLQKSEKGLEYVTLVSQNRHHQPKEIHLKNINALALVKASVRMNSMG